MEMPNGTAVCYPLEAMVIPRHLINDPLKGYQLSFFPALQMTMKDWLMLYPDRLIFRIKSDVPRGRIPVRMLRRMLKVTNHLMVPGQTEIGTDFAVAREYIWVVTERG